MSVSNVVIGLLIAGAVIIVGIIALAALALLVLFIFREQIGRAIAYGLGFAFAVVLDILLFAFPPTFPIWLILRLIICIIAVIVYGKFWPEIIFGFNQMMGDLFAYKKKEEPPKDKK